MTLAHVPPEVIRPIKLVEYERLADSGAFDDEKVELLYGRIIQMVPQGEPHSIGIMQLNELLTPKLLGRARVRIQMPFAAPHESLPEPDVAVVPLRDGLARPSDAYLIVEVAVSSLAIDRAKALLYAQAKVPQYWLVDVRGDAVEVHREPSESGYATVTRHVRGDELVVPGFPDVVLPVAHVLPPK